MTKRARSRATDRVWAVGLASATCVGLVATMGVRAAEAAAPESDSPSVAPTTGEPTSASGLTAAELDAYQAQLDAQRAELLQYREDLARAARKLARQTRILERRIARQQTAAGASSASRPATQQPAPSRPTTRPVPAPPAAPAQPARPAKPAKPAKPAQPAPQSQTQSS
jgi:hypothetical protein